LHRRMQFDYGVGRVVLGVHQREHVRR